MIINVLTLFPDMFHGFLAESMIAIAIENQKLKVNLFNIRDYSLNKHRKVDDYPYGGGSGMIMTPEPIYNCLQAVKNIAPAPVIYFTPQGRLLTQQIVQEYSQIDNVILLCGHYKEIDQRIRDTEITDEISIGDYVLSGGEIPAMVLIDAVARLQEGVLHDIDSALTDSHQNKMLGCPHYTRPREFNGLSVPEVLLNGNHKEIENWRKNKALDLTRLKRPELLNEK